jgi:hypothetical protein
MFINGKVAVTVKEGLVWICNLSELVLKKQDIPRLQLQLRWHMLKEGENFREGWRRKLLALENF